MEPHPKTAQSGQLELSLQGAGTRARFVKIRTTEVSSQPSA